MKRTLFPTHALFYKATLIFSLMLLFQMNSFAQGPKWTTLGNITAAGDFIGPTNLQPLVFRTNNIIRGAFSATGNFQLNNLIGTGNRLLQTDAGGNIIPFTMGTPSQVLYGNGIWGALPIIPTSLWNNSGSNIYFNTGKVGIGTSTPLYPLDVIGDVRISNNLYVGGGIIITDRVNANAEVVTGKMKADSIVTDSTKGFYGVSKFNGDVKLQNKLFVDGAAVIGGDFKTMGNITFAGDKSLGYIPATATSPEMFTIGKTGYLPTLPPICNSVLTPDGTINLFAGAIRCFGNSGTGDFNIVTMGYDGSNGIIDVAGDNGHGMPGPDLLLNYYCGKNVLMCSGVNGGKVGIGTASIPSEYKLAVKGKIIAEEVNVRLFGDWPDYVFDEDYKSLSIPELRDFTKKEKHLPNMPTAENVEKNGVNLSEIVAKLLRSQEEQTKYIIQLYEQNLLLKKEIELLKK